MNGLEYIWIVWALLSAFFTATMTIFGRIGIEKVDSTVATTLRVLVMLILLMIISVFSQKIVLINTVDKRAFLFIVLCGASGALSWLFYFLALQACPASKVYALNVLSLAFVMFLATFIGEVITTQMLFGALLLILGALLISWK